MKPFLFFLILILILYCPSMSRFPWLAVSVLPTKISVWVSVPVVLPVPLHTSVVISLKLFVKMTDIPWMFSVRVFMYHPVTSSLLNTNIFRTPVSNVSRLFTFLLACLLTYLLTYFFTPCSRVILEKLTGSQLVKKSPAFHGTRRFITAFTSARHLSLSWARSIQSIPHIPLLENIF